MEEGAQFLESGLHGGHRLVLHFSDRLARAAGLGVGGQRIGQLVGQAQQVHDQPARLVPIDAVHAGDRLHQVVPGQRLIQIHGVRRRAVEAGQPHVADDHKAEVIARGLEALGQALAGGLGAHMVPERLGIFVGAGHDHLHRAAFVVGVVPVRAQRADRLVEPRGDVAAHGHYHRLAFHRGAALLPVLDDERC